MLRKNKKLRNIKVVMMTILIAVALVGMKIKGENIEPNDNVGKRSELCYDYVFLGDSITFRNDWHYFYPNATLINSGIDGNRTWQIADRLKADVYFYHPKKVIILIGVNDTLNHVSFEKTIKNVDEMIAEIQQNLPDTEIYLQSVYPINGVDFNDEYLPNNNRNILKINEQYKKIAKKYSVTYIDVYSHLIDDAGNLNPIYTKDGLHLSLLGYIAVTEVLNSYIIDQEETSK